MTQFDEKYQITKEEKEIVTKALADRFRNYVYLGSEQLTERALEQIWSEKRINMDDTIKITLTISQVIADLLVELGNIRRPK